MNACASALNGAWEEPGVYGNRIEIEGDRITFLWRNCPTLETTFRLKETDGGAELALKKKGLRNTPDSSPYADVTSLVWKEDERGGALELTEYFPISGESRETLRKTENSRYGSYEIVDEVLPQLAGTWKDEKGFFTLTIRGDEIDLNGEKTRIHALRSKDGDPRILLADQDPAITEWQGLSRFEYDGLCLHTRMLILDAGTVEIFLKRE